MEEKEVFKNVRTKTKLWLILLIVLALVAYVWSVSFVFQSDEYERYKEHTLWGEHDYECYNEIGREVYDRCGGYDFHLLVSEAEGATTSNCPHYFESEFDYCIHALVTSPNGELPMIAFLTGVCLLAVSVCIVCMCRGKSKFSVSENSIYGKKGHKKFHISFGDITALSKEGNGIVIKTEKEQLKLSPLKQCEEIYRHIKSFVPESATGAIGAQATNTVDDIKLF